MSTTTTAPHAPEHPAHGGHAPGGHAHGDHAHASDLAHHFDSYEQQFDAGKLGIWVFLVTEILFFSGLFCAYSVWRAHHPEAFLYAHHYLDTFWGFVNTCVLLTSSLTMAWAVRAAQLGQKKLLIAMLIGTLGGAFGFLAIKYIEYSHKFHEGLFPGALYDPHNPILFELTRDGHYVEQGHAWEILEREQGLTADELHHMLEHDKAHLDKLVDDLSLRYAPEPKSVSTFFSIYFGMTGLHGIHVLGGIVVILWILVRSIRGDFNANYFGPVDYVGLYWHLVDLIWIFLFPLLYLIH